MVPVKKKTKIAILIASLAVFALVLAAALLLSRGDPSVFVTRPISCGLLIAAAILLILVLAPSIRKKREVAFQDDD